MDDIFKDVFNNYQAAEYLTQRGYKVSPAVLSNITNVGAGPRFEKGGHYKFYRKSWLDDFLARKEVKDDAP